jgi:hypothetical protein
MYTRTLPRTRKQTLTLAGPAQVSDVGGVIERLVMFLDSGGEHLTGERWRAPH